LNSRKFSALKETHTVSGKSKEEGEGPRKMETGIGEKDCGSRVFPSQRRISFCPVI
jgi:hypothetical protein